MECQLHSTEFITMCVDIHTDMYNVLKLERKYVLLLVLPFSVYELQYNILEKSSLGNVLTFHCQ
jgi:hypothetical protein